MKTVRGYKTFALFAGVAGLELGLHAAGHQTAFFSEIDPGAVAVLKNRFPSIPVEGDVRNIRRLPAGIELVTAGFPCQDISQAGGTRGLSGKQSGLVSEVFRLLATADVPHVLLENVSFMLSLGAGAIMRAICDEFDRLGYRWAYRVLDSRAFGIPQRRERVFLLASRESSPKALLFHQDAGPRDSSYSPGTPCGFYWTEGTRGLGWAINAVPTLKGGSTVGIPSPPAIWLSDGRVVKPDLRDGERLQGLEPDWTKPAEEVCKKGHRWKLVGNAVNVRTAEWVGRAMLTSPRDLSLAAADFDQFKSWPRAAFGGPGETRMAVSASAWPEAVPCPSIESFLRYEAEPLSVRALSGFLSRLKASSLRGYPPEFIPSLERFMHRQQRGFLQ